MNNVTQADIYCAADYTYCSRANLNTHLQELGSYPSFDTLPAYARASLIASWLIAGEILYFIRRFCRLLR